MDTAAIQALRPHPGVECWLDRSIAMPQTFQSERRCINTCLTLLFCTQALMRFDKPKARRKNETQCKNQNLLSAVMDEFQALATKKVKK